MALDGGQNYGRSWQCRKTLNEIYILQYKVRRSYTYMCILRGLWYICIYV